MTRLLPRRARSLVIWSVGLTLFVAGGACTSSSTDAGREGLLEARRLWEQQGAPDYRIDVRRLCFCGYDVTRSVRVTVRDGVVVDRVYADDGTAIQADPSLFPDVAGLFDVIEDAFARGAHSVDVVYDSSLGYPTTIAIDYIEQAIDEEVTFQTENYTVQVGGA